MLSTNQPPCVQLKQVYYLERSPFEHAVAANMEAGAPHCFTFSLKGELGVMTVDNQPQSATTFPFVGAPHGYFSLASNATEPEAGAFRYIHLQAGGKTLLDIHFENVRSVEELEPYFDCYYFPDLERDREGIPAQIGQFWALNKRGHLHCIRERTDRISVSDCGPVCMLTLRHAPIGDFKATVGFEQCWRRHGIVFGCERRRFPYYSLPDAGGTAGVQGGFAFIGAHNGARCVRGALKADEDKEAQKNASSITSYRYGVTDSLASSFQSNKQTTLPYHTLAYCRTGSITYTFADGQFTEQAGAVVYLPPNIPCSLSGEADSLIRIEFECMEHRCFTPAIYVPNRPETVKELFEELTETWYKTLAGKEYRALSLFYRILEEISRPPATGGGAAVHAAIRYIDTHFPDAKLSVGEVAKAANVSESYLYRLFREAGEISPKEYILTRRVRHARRLLETRCYKVYEVAQKCGFSDTKYFMTVFKQRMGVSPGHYASKREE